MAVTTACGKVVLAQAHAEDYQGLDALEESVLEHSLETWVTAFSPSPQEAEPEGQQQQGQHPPFTIFSGGDDSALRYTTYDPSSSTSSSSSDPPNHTPYLPLTIRSSHAAGVTSILPLPVHVPHRPSAQHLVLTGSYDDHLRLHTITPTHLTHGVRKADTLAERDLGGGVWRLNLIRPLTRADDDGGWEVTVLASCMHAGARVVRLRGCGEEKEEEGVDVEVLARFEEHASMNYGSDWSRSESRLAVDGGGKAREVLCVSTSFYDRLLCVWSFTL